MIYSFYITSASFRLFYHSIYSTRHYFPIPSSYYTLSFLDGMLQVRPLSHLQCLFRSQHFAPLSIMSASPSPYTSLVLPSFLIYTSSSLVRAIPLLYLPLILAFFIVVILVMVFSVLVSHGDSYFSFIHNAKILSTAELSTFLRLNTERQE